MPRWPPRVCRLAMVARPKLDASTPRGPFTVGRNTGEAVGCVVYPADETVSRALRRDPCGVALTKCVQDQAKPTTAVLDSPLEEV